MNYTYKLILRVITAFLIVFSSNLLYKLLFSPMFYLSYFLLFPYKPVILNNILLINDKKLVFISACVATSAYLLLAILILLTKDIAFKKGVKIFIIGFFTLFIVNLLRIYFLALILLEFNIGLFETLHLFFWQVFSTIFVFLLWIFLTKYFKIKTIPIYSDFKHLLKELK